MHHLLAHHPVAAPKEVLSLEEILAEGETGVYFTFKKIRISSNTKFDVVQVPPRQSVETATLLSFRRRRASSSARARSKLFTRPCTTAQRITTWVNIL